MKYKIVIISTALVLLVGYVGITAPPVERSDQSTNMELLNLLDTVDLTFTYRDVTFNIGDKFSEEQFSLLEEFYVSEEQVSIDKQATLLNKGSKHKITDVNDDKFYSTNNQNKILVGGQKQGGSYFAVGIQNDKDDLSSIFDCTITSISYISRESMLDEAYIDLTSLSGVPSLVKDVSGSGYVYDYLATYKVNDNNLVVMYTDKELIGFSLERRE